MGVLEFALLSMLLAAESSKDAALQSFAKAPSSETTATVECSTSVGLLTIDVKSDWAPKGAARFIEMVDALWFENLYMPRVVRRYLTQFGPRLSTQSSKYPIHFPGLLDDPSLATWFGKNQNISTGTMFFAGGGTNSRGTDMCIALCPPGACASLGHEEWETPFAVIRELDNVRKIDKRSCTPICKGKPCLRDEGPPDEGKNCDMPPFGIGPGPEDIRRGEGFLHQQYPQMAKFHSCTVVRRSEEHKIRAQ